MQYALVQTYLLAGRKNVGHYPESSAISKVGVPAPQRNGPGAIERPTIDIDGPRRQSSAVLRHQALGG